MKVRDLNGDVRNWKLSCHIVRSSDERPRSQLHLKARKLLTELYPTVQIMEEVPVTIRRGQTSYFDFFINTIKLVIEVHGAQHYKYNTLYHSSAQDFINQKRRDADKKEWCELNNFTYIELPYNEKTEQWKYRILQRNS